MLYYFIMALTNLHSGSINQLDGLIPDKSRDILQKENWELFQRDIEERLRIYNDDWEDILAGYIKSQLSIETQRQFFPANKPISWPIPLTMNLMKRVIKQTSRIYGDNAGREYVEEVEKEEDKDVVVPEQGITDEIDTDEEPEIEIESSERYSDIVKAGFNATMQTVNEMTNLCNIVLVRPVADEKKKTGFRFDILTPDIFTPIQHPDNPEQLIGVMYTIDFTDTPGTEITNIGGTTTKKSLIFYMGTGEPGDDAFFAETSNDDKGEIVKQPYPYVFEGKPYLPFAVFRNSQPLVGQFMNRTKGDDLVQGTKMASYLLSRWIRAFEKTTTGKQVVATGPKTDMLPKNLIFDLYNVLQIPGTKDDVEVNFLDHTVDIKELWESLKDYIESIVAAYGLTQEKFSGVAQSGVALTIKNEELRANIEKQWPIFREGENDLAWLTRRENNRVLNTNDFGAISETAEFQLDFGNLPGEPDPLDTIEKKAALLPLNAVSVAEMVMDLNPDIPDIDTAQEQVLENARLNREAKQGTLDSLAPGQAGNVDAITPVPEEEAEQIEAQQNILNDSPAEDEVDA